MLLMSLSVLPTARNIPPKLVVQNIKHLNAFVIQGDKMFLNVIILDPGVQFLSVENLPVVNMGPTKECPGMPENARRDS